MSAVDNFFGKYLSHFENFTVFSILIDIFQYAMLTYIKLKNLKQFSDLKSFQNPTVFIPVLGRLRPFNLQIRDVNKNFYLVSNNQSPRVPL